MGTIKNQFVKFHDGFAIEEADVTFGNHSVIIAFAVYDTTKNIRTWSLDFYDPSSGLRVSRRTYKTDTNMMKAVKAHCAEYGIEWDELEHVNNLQMITIKNDFMKGDPDQIREMYEGTTAHDLALSFFPGQSVHVGEGMWLTRCAYCHKVVAHLGTMPRNASLGHHMETEHAEILIDKGHAK
ncbi:hypothetical protein PBI_CANTARE_84 [Brevibacterium phage Cantare]|uniref:Uncharacterized protein n=1 Tax=Brevibacterium phage Cantare TaxID=2338395 RepID=A0A3G3LYT4_9CAUD|nr:hypothetical protein PQD70_gp084 [Brevibacterium phage Cantare]AYQ99304.1 hypothetical protein PBI_CANTARE_84 [Brevibacterium phage Cantare]